MSLYGKGNRHNYLVNTWDFIMALAHSQLQSTLTLLSMTQRSLRVRVETHKHRYRSSQISMRALFHIQLSMYSSHRSRPNKPWNACEFTQGYQIPRYTKPYKTPHLANFNQTTRSRNHLDTKHTISSLKRGRAKSSRQDTKLGRIPHQLDPSHKDESLAQRRNTAWILPSTEPRIPRTIERDTDESLPPSQHGHQGTRILPSHLPEPRIPRTTERGAQRERRGRRVPRRLRRAGRRRPAAAAAAEQVDLRRDGWPDGGGREGGDPAAAFVDALGRAGLGWECRKWAVILGKFWPRILLLPCSTQDKVCSCLLPHDHILVLFGRVLKFWVV